MATSVYVPIAISEVVEAEELPSRTYRLDLDAGRIVGFVDGLEAVNQAIRKAIITPRFKCLIYDNQYGSEIEDAIIAKDASTDYIESVTEGFVRDALKPDTRILDVYDFEFEFKDDAAYISFKADTIYGETEIEEVI
ncbi:MAG: DUF2634 domain-containing protein [Oscillospiraceae bacterium]|nr:DUF2634 domain-containing protein [Oscillospiraceae bacterium]